MKYKLFLFILIALRSIQVFGQNDKPIILKTLTDSFTYSERSFERKFAIRYGDTSGFGTNYYGNIFRLKTESDSVVVRFRPELKPYYRNSTTVHVTSPKGKQVIYLIFHPATCWFSNEYVTGAEGAVQYDIPEVFELANVLYTLTSSSASNSIRTLKSSPYYGKVLSYFSNYKDHPILKKVEFLNDAKGSTDYYNFRDNSFCFTIKEGKIVPNNQYYVVWGEYQDNLFNKYLDLVNDFYIKSNFHQFYQSNLSYYASLIKTQQQLMPAKKMWQWLEKNFSQKINSYRVIFSPLINGSHGTQLFFWKTGQGKDFVEAVMFTSGTRGVESNNQLTNDQKEGISSGILFTEIDHNYCNQISERYKKSIDSTLINRENWVDKDGDGGMYPSQMAIFNEYITHAVFLLYAYDMFKYEDFLQIKKERERIMLEQRKYIKFREFSDQLLELYKNRNPEQKVMDLFPAIIAWCKSRV